ncbi:DEAD/DEAH box helicase [Shewanella violacea]|nr:DEAD/DEAH box helicase [Shewanella violacea]
MPLLRFDHSGPILSGQFDSVPTLGTVEGCGVSDGIIDSIVTATLDWSAGPVIASGNTTCSVCSDSQLPCIHIAAIAIDYLAKQVPITPYPSETKRADTASRLLRTELNKRYDPYPNMARHRVVYLLSVTDGELHLSVHKGYVSKLGKYSIKTDLGFEVLDRGNLPKFVTQTDVYLLHRLRELAQALDTGARDALQERLSIGLGDTCAGEFLYHLIATQRCFWLHCDQVPLKIEQHNLDDFVDPKALIKIDSGQFLDLASMSLVLTDLGPFWGELSDKPLAEYLRQLADDDREWAPKLKIHRARVDFPWDEQNHLDIEVASFSLCSENLECSLADIFALASESPHLLKLASELSIQLSDFQLLSSGFEPIVWHQFLLGDRELPQILSQQMVAIRRLMLAGWSIDFQLINRYSLVQAHTWYGELSHQAPDKQWFDLELGVEVDGKKINLLPYLVKAIRQGLLQNLSDTETVLMELDSGQRLSLPADRIKQILSVLVELYETKPLSVDDTLTMSMNQLTRIAELADRDKINKKEWQWLGSQWLQNKAQQLYSYLEVDGNDKGAVSKNSHGKRPGFTVLPPVGLNAELREYQQLGLNWLQFLKKNEFSGMLADDMGLGKTIQTLSSILLDKEAGNLSSPCLVVAPTSLLANWLHEAETFAPELRLLLWSGPKRHRLQDKIKDCDLLITSYGTLQQDVELWAKQHFHLVILDEAQTIKNVRSRINRVVGSLSSTHRLCLTGTPLENHLGELWSLFNFLMPGFLGTYAQFQRHYQVPIEKEQDDERRCALVQRIAPFMLRRLKSEVAKELPDKTVINEFISLTETQRDLYETIRLTMSEEVRKAVSVSGVKRNRLAISNALLKLRQVCCHPKLLKLDHLQQSSQDNVYLDTGWDTSNIDVSHKLGSVNGLQLAEDVSKLDTRSGKLNWLADKLPGMLEEGRRVLIFSSFTSMLTLIGELLENLGISFVELTGKSRDRGALVKRFQQREVPVFLISLKAGGAGLNLTAADVVIHTDPWWNPAAEQQASDRAHRIGQDKSVFVYKLICKETVEERIQLLQESKNNLAQSIYQQESLAVSDMTGDDWLELLKPINLDD